jgi:hypothetical protein
VYAPELDPINVQKQPRLRIPQAAAADLESGTDLSPSNAAPSTLQVQYRYLKKIFVFASRQKIRLRETPLFASTVMLTEMYSIFKFSRKCGKNRFRSFSQRRGKRGWLKFFSKQRL